MQKSLTYVVTVSFDEPIEDSQIKEVAQNIGKAIERMANNEGFSPEDSEAITTEVVVSERGIIMATEEIYKPISG